MKLEKIKLKQKIKICEYINKKIIHHYALPLLDDCIDMRPRNEAKPFRTKLSSKLFFLELFVGFIQILHMFFHYKKVFFESFI